MQIAVGRDRDAVRRVELRLGRGTEVAGEAGAERVVADDRPDGVVAAAVDAPDHVVVRVGEVDVAVRRDGDAAGRVEPRLERRAVVAGVSLARADHLPLSPPRAA